MKKSILLFYCGICACWLHAQSTCLTLPYAQEPSTQQLIDKRQEKVRNWIATHPNRADTTYCIPVVVHILYRNEYEDFSNAAITDMLAALNQSFSKTNPLFENTLDEFKPLAADTGIEFRLADTDPFGNATSGIIRKEVPSDFDLKEEYYTPIGSAPWDVERYLNIWFGRMFGGAALTVISPQELEGILIGNSPIFDDWLYAELLCHEAGHYLGLQHLSSGLMNGTCTYDDFIADTPPQDTVFYLPTDCPEGYILDACSTELPGVMYQNYMQFPFSTTPCLTMFTHGQKTVMQATLETYRSELVRAGDCMISTSVYDLATPAKFRLFPNPVHNMVTIDTDISKLPMQISVLNIQGKTVMETLLDSNTTNMDVTNLPEGMYFVFLSDEKQAYAAQKMVVAR